MPWSRVDDGWSDHPKVIGLSLAAKGLWLVGLSYASRNLTDGLVPAAVCYREGSPDEVQDAMNQLIDAGLWSWEGERHVRIHDFLEYNPSKAQVEAERTKTKERVANWREKRKAEDPAPDNVTALHGRYTPVSNGGVTPAPVPVPVPNRTPNGVLAPAAPKNKTRRVIPEEWTPDEKGRTYASNIGIGNIDREVERFKDFHRAKGNTFLDFAAAWRTWCNNVPRMNPDAIERAPGERKLRPALA